jgi:hypothetical protein
VTIDAFRTLPNQRKYPEATRRHVKRILEDETDPKILGEEIALTESDYGGPHVVRPAGALMSPAELCQMRLEVFRRLTESNFSAESPLSRSEDRARWDRVVGAALNDLVSMEPFQRYGEESWTYLTVHVFPEFPKWRFPGRRQSKIDEFGDEQEERVRPIDRVVGGRRNVLFRVWHRAHVLGGDLRIPVGADPLGEDELDNIFGRPGISRNHVLTRQIVDAVYRNIPERTETRRLVLRELLKEIRRRYHSVHFAALEPKLQPELDLLWGVAMARHVRNLGSSGKS